MAPDVVAAGAPSPSPGQRGGDEDQHLLGFVDQLVPGHPDDEPAEGVQAGVAQPVALEGRPSAVCGEAVHLGADPFQTFRLVTFPLMRSALLAGGLLAFALSFDEIIVTTFTVSPSYKTLPLWFADNFARPNAIPVVNVVATFVVLASTIPVYLAQRISDGAATFARE